MICGEGYDKAMKQCKFLSSKAVTVTAALIMLAAALVYFDVIPFGTDKTITIGVFSGSYWEVPNGNSYKIVDDAIKKFEAEHKGVKVEYISGVTRDDYSEWLAGRVLEGTAPDVFFVGSNDFNMLAELGALRDLSSVIEKDSGFNEEDYYSSAYSCGRHKEAQYALPFESAVYLMFVNKTMLANEGIEPPKADWTWADFYDICRRVTKDTDGDGRTDQYGVYGYTWKEAVTSNGTSVFADDGRQCRLSDDKVVQAVSFVERLEELNNGYEVTSDSFDLGKVAFQPLMFSEYRAYKPYPLRVKKYSGFEWDCITMPAGPSGGNISSMDTLMLAMNRGTKNKEYAWELMKTLAYDPEIQSEIFMYSEGVSPLKSVAQSESVIGLLGQDGAVNFSLLDEAMKNAKVRPSFKNYTSAVKMVDTAVRDTIDGSANISMSLIKWQRDINSRLN